ncbi:MAG TPA: TIGR03086 family metal-binding protein [Acidimicrobiales bacterium]|nr:TIGR03086 family metal-binding protein [Acidimicrobiales bacterium]
MGEGKEKYLRGLDGAQTVIDMVKDDQWEAQSPCADWKAADVVGHLISGTNMVSSLATTGETGSFSAPREYLVGDDPKASFAAARTAMEANLTPDNLSRVVKSPFGEMPLDQFLNVITLDAIAHTWDLSQAIGHEVTLPPDLVHDCFEGVKPLDAILRQPNLFGPKVEPPAGADEQTELMAFLGRTV